MQLHATLWIALAARWASAIIVPEGLPNGVHVVEDDGLGNHTFRFLGDYLQDGHVPAASAKFRRAALPAGELGCSSSGLDYSDLSGAQAQMYSYCGASGNIGSQMLTFTHGTAFTYTCRYTAANTCAAGEAQAAFSLLANNCGNPSSPLGGWYWLKDWAKNYGYDAVGADVCTNLPDEASCLFGIFC